jgi:hypothetical protein
MEDTVRVSLNFGLSGQQLHVHVPRQWAESAEGRSALNNGTVNEIVKQSHNQKAEDFFRLSA